MSMLASWKELVSSLELGICLSEHLVFVHAWRSLTEVVLMEAQEMLLLHSSSKYTCK